MKKKTLRLCGQSLLEYAVVVMIAATALVAMNHYIRGAVQARLKNIQVELDEWRR